MQPLKDNATRTQELRLSWSSEGISSSVRSGACSIQDEIWNSRARLNSARLAELGSRLGQVRDPRIKFKLKLRLSRKSRHPGAGIPIFKFGEHVPSICFRCCFRGECQPLKASGVYSCERFIPEAFQLATEPSDFKSSKPDLSASRAACSTWGLDLINWKFSQQTQSQSVSKLDLPRSSSGSPSQKFPTDPDLIHPPLPAHCSHHPHCLGCHHWDCSHFPSESQRASLLSFLESGHPLLFHRVSSCSSNFIKLTCQFCLSLKALSNPCDYPLDIKCAPHQLNKLLGKYWGRIHGIDPSLMFFHLVFTLRSHLQLDPQLRSFLRRLARDLIRSAGGIHGLLVDGLEFSPEADPSGSWKLELQCLTISRFLDLESIEASWEQLGSLHWELFPAAQLKPKLKYVLAHALHPLYLPPQRYPELHAAVFYHHKLTSWGIFRTKSKSEHQDPLQCPCCGNRFTKGGFICSDELSFLSGIPPDQIPPMVFIPSRLGLVIFLIRLSNWILNGPGPPRSSPSQPRD